MIEFRHADTLPYLAVRLNPGDDRPATVDVRTGPADQPVRGITDPRELRAMAWRLLDGARWLDRQHQPTQTMTDTPNPHDDLLARAEKLVEAATPGPWGWGGFIDGAIELRTLHSGGLRVVTTIRPQQCMAELADGEIGLTVDACDACRAKTAEVARTGNGDLWEGYSCPRPENLATLWLWDEKGFCRPANHWAERERPYRGDVARVVHPDAELIAAAPEIIADLAAALRAQTAENERLVGRVQDVHDRLPDDLTEYGVGKRDGFREVLEFAAERGLAEARAAAPQPLLRGVVSTTGGGYVDIGVARDTDAYPETGTDVVLYRADQIAGARGTSDQASNETDPKPAAPRPLWQGKAQTLNGELDHGGVRRVLKVPHDTEIAVYRAGDKVEPMTPAERAALDQLENNDG